jgi:hypothetical protein
LHGSGDAGDAEEDGVSPGGFDFVARLESAFQQGYLEFA